MNFDLSLLQGRIYLPWDRPLRGRGGGNRSVYIHGICIQWRRRGGGATRGANTRFDYFRVVSKPISDFCTTLLSRAEQRIIPSDPPEREGLRRKQISDWRRRGRKAPLYLFSTLHLSTLLLSVFPFTTTLLFYAVDPLDLGSFFSSSSSSSSSSFSSFFH